MSKEAMLLALGYMDGTLVTEHLTGYERKRHVMNALREALADHIPDDGKMVEQPQQEPFGYFRAEPFGWTDCAETDDGAVALYERPPAQRAPPKWTDAEVSNGCCGIRWVNAEGVQGVPTREDVEKYLGYTFPPSGLHMARSDVESLWSKSWQMPGSAQQNFAALVLEKAAQVCDGIDQSASSNAPVLCAMRIRSMAVALQSGETSGALL